MNLKRPVKRNSNKWHCERPSLMALEALNQLFAELNQLAQEAEQGDWEALLPKYQAWSEKLASLQHPAHPSTAYQHRFAEIMDCHQRLQSKASVAHKELLAAQSKLRSSHRALQAYLSQ